MFATNIYTERRKQLMAQFQSGILLFMGNEESSMNYHDNVYPFRQDSTFLYYFGINQPHLTAMINLDSGQTTIFGDEFTMSDIIWIGAHPSLKEQAVQVGVSSVSEKKQIATVLQNALKKGQAVHYLPPYRAKNVLKLHEWLQIPVADIKNRASLTFIKAVIAQRSIKGTEEIAEMEKALAVTRDIHHLVMDIGKAGMLEREMSSAVAGIAQREGCTLAYPTILTVNGQTLHNHYHGNRLENGQLVLCDFGVATAMNYASDITRTFPVSKKFTAQQKEIYDIVLTAQLAAIEAMKPGRLFLHIHLMAARIMAEGLKQIGLMKGDMEAAVMQGAHTLFFPHGLGHAIGLDVHDMEDLGEDNVGYDETVQRSAQFGTAYLRFGRALQTGMVMTVEPGLYFIPELIDKWQSEGKFTNFINYDALGAYRTFGGIRIEDNVLVTEDGHRVLGEPIRKSGW